MRKKHLSAYVLLAAALSRKAEALGAEDTLRGLIYLAFALLIVWVISQIKSWLQKYGEFEKEPYKKKNGKEEIEEELFRDKEI